MKKEHLWYLGFFAGAAGAGLLVQMHLPDLHNLLRLVLILSAGVGCGWLAESLCATRVKGPR